MALMGELLPSNARSFGIGLVSVTHDAVATLVVYVLPYLDHAIGVGLMFGIFACNLIIIATFCFFCVPETSGKSLEEIEAHYRQLCYGSAEPSESDNKANC